MMLYDGRTYDHIRSYILLVSFLLFCSKIFLPVFYNKYYLFSYLTFFCFFIIVIHKRVTL